LQKFIYDVGKYIQARVKHFMKSVFTLSITIILTFSCITVSAQENPFMKMAGRKYADYSYELKILYDKTGNEDTVVMAKTINQLKEVAEKTGSNAWKMEVKIYELELIIKKNQLNENTNGITGELQMAFDLLNQAKKENLPQNELWLRYLIIDTYWRSVKNYELAFEQCVLQNKRLMEISTEDVPEKALYYIQIANCHYSFKDYPNAIFYFNRILEEKETIDNQRSQLHARNGLGLCYQEAYNDLDRSDYYFHEIMQVNHLGPDKVSHHELWDGIALGSLGYNMFLRGKYDQAILLLKSGIEKVLNQSDYGYAAGVAINLADSYMEKGNPSEGKKYIDLAWKYYEMRPRDGRLLRLYDVMNKYYTDIGNKKLSAAYMDSALRTKEQNEKQFNAMLLFRVEQQESIKQQQEVVQEKEQRRQVQTRLLIISVCFIVISILLILLYLFYRRRLSAYRELVRISQEWVVRDQPEKEQETHIVLPDELDLSIMEDIEQLMLREKVYHDHTISVDSLARLLGYKKHNISGAINRCTKNNFTTLINEYRIKEAIQLMSDKKFQNYSIDSIAFEVGFNDRKTFYTAFHKKTGLSPSEFKSTLKKR